MSGWVGVRLHFGVCKLMVLFSHRGGRVFVSKSFKRGSHTIPSNY